MCELCVCVSELCVSELRVRELCVSKCVCVCPALYQRVSHDLTQNAGASGPSYLPDAAKLWYDGGRVN